MAGDRRTSERQSRRDREASEERQQRLIYLGAVGVLAVVALVVAFGIFWTRYLPPRAHILTIEDQSYNASAVADRGKFLITFEGQDDLLGNVASAAIDVLIFEETLRLRGPALVGPVTQPQIDAQVQELLGFEPLASTITPIPGADDAPDDGDDADPPAGDGTDDASAGDGDTEPEPEVMPTPLDDLFAPPAAAPRSLSESEQDDFAVALAAVLSATGLSRGDFEDIAEARVVRLLLNRHFDGQLGPNGEQLRLQRFVVSNPAEAEELRQRVLDGEPFGDLVLEADADSAANVGLDSEPGDLGWFPRDLIPDEIADALVGVEAGNVSEVVDRSLTFEVYFVTEIDPARVWDDAARQLLVRDLVREWEEVQSDLLAIEIGLSDGEEVWIIERVVSHVTGLVGAPIGGQ